MAAEAAAHREESLGLAELKDWAGAVERQFRAVELAPQHSKWYYELGILQQRLKNREGAIQAFQSAVARAPRNAQYLYHLARAFEVVNDLDRARSCYRRAESLSAGPHEIPRDIAKHLTLDRRIALSIVDKPAYAYSLLRACRLANKLDIPRISAIEFGVAGGNGLLALESIATTVEAETDVAVDVYGLDTGEGLFEPRDERDLPYNFAGGNYAMDIEKLEARLRRAELVIGDAAKTLPKLMQDGLAPIGMMSFDMDLYTATAEVLAHLGDGADEHKFLPRTKLYFDDVIGAGVQDYNEFTGELLAIAEFNEGNGRTKIAKDRTVQTYLPQPGWQAGIYTLHRFDHPSYSRYIHSAGPESLRLKV